MLFAGLIRGATLPCASRHNLQHEVQEAGSLGSLPRHFKANSLLAGLKMGLCVTVFYQVDFNQFY